MKRPLLLLMAIGLSVTLFAQYHPVLKNKNVVRTQTTVAISEPLPGEKPANELVSRKSVLDDAQVMTTYYDLMSNSAIGESQLVLWPDGSMAQATTMSLDAGGSWGGRGTGYNYSTDGITWGAEPDTRIETLRTGWPSLQPLGANGECVVSHQSGTAPLVFCKRDTRGTGAWTESLIPTPAGASGMLWARMITSGTDNTMIHIIAMTAPTGNGGIEYNGMDGALLYVKSTDGGQTWGAWQQLAGMTATDIISFSADDYGWANPQGSNICFFSAGSFTDTFIMKSTDDGATWTKTIVHSSPYNMVGVEGNSPSAFYTSDGTASVALDGNGIAHMTFALMRDSLSGSTTYNYFPYTEGVVYWNETMDMLPENLSPYELPEANVIGWVVDTNIYYVGDGTLAQYSANSLTSMPTMSIDENGFMLVIWSCPTTIQDGNNYMLRHLYGRLAKIDETGTPAWGDSIYMLNTDFNYMFSECVWPSLAMKSTDMSFFVKFMADDLAGSYVNSITVGADYEGQTSMTDNFIMVSTIDKESIGVNVGIKEKEKVTSFTISQNYPNPVNGATTFGVYTEKAGNVSIDVTNVSGQKVISLDKGHVSAGSIRYSVDCSSLQAGIYFYTVTINNESVTRKMIVM